MDGKMGMVRLLLEGGMFLPVGQPNSRLWLLWFSAGEGHAKVEKSLRAWNSMSCAAWEFTSLWRF